MLIDYPVHVTDMEHVDLFNWQEQAKNMVSQIEFTRRVSVQSETVERYNGIFVRESSSRILRFPSVSAGVSSTFTRKPSHGMPGNTTGS